METMHTAGEGALEAAEQTREVLDAEAQRLKENVENEAQKLKAGVKNVAKKFPKTQAKKRRDSGHVVKQVKAMRKLRSVRRVASST